LISNLETDIAILLSLAKRAAALGHQKLSEIVELGPLPYRFPTGSLREPKAKVDTIVEAAILEILRPSGVAILSEEVGDYQLNDHSDLRFVVDPIDGTYNLVRGVGPAVISIGLFCANRPVFGVMSIFPSNELVWGGKDLGSFVNGRSFNVSPTTKMHQAIVCAGFPARFDFLEDQAALKYVQQIRRFGKVRMLGSAAFSLYQVANGSADVYYEKEIMLWDVAAGLAILEGAGGQFSLTPGNSVGAVTVFASNGRFGEQ